MTDGSEWCIIHCLQVRVLAGTDCSGSIPMVQGKLSDNSLFIASRGFYPRDARDVEDIPAGHYKYGWHAGAMKFANPESEARHSAEEASSAANAALAGLFCKTTDRVGKPRRSSLDSAHLSHFRKSENRRKSLDAVNVGRHSMDSASTKNRADGHDWWRSNEQHQHGHGHGSLPKSSKKSGKRSKKKQNTTASKTPKAKSPAEEFINKLGKPSIRWIHPRSAASF